MNCPKCHRTVLPEQIPSGIKGVQLFRMACCGLAILGHSEQQVMDHWSRTTKPLPTTKSRRRTQ